MFRRPPPDQAPPPDRNWTTRLAWLVIVGGIALVGVRASVATVVRVHGDGMAPTIVDGENVLLVRGRWGLQRGDVVIYDPTPPPPPAEELAPEYSPYGAPDEDSAQLDHARPERGELRNTAVVDVEELEGNWRKVQRRSGAEEDPAPVSRTFRVGRVLAVPGDTVTFNVPDAAMGLQVNGVPLKRKDTEPMQIVLRGQPQPGEDPAEVETPQIRATAYEWTDDVRYTVLLELGEPRWEGMNLPSDVGPVEVEATGYLVLADNRQEGACCDSRALGFVDPGHVRGEVVARLAGDPEATPDLDPRSRGLAWLP